MITIDSENIDISITTNIRIEVIRIASGCKRGRTLLRGGVKRLSFGWEKEWNSALYCSELVWVSRWNIAATATACLYGGSTNLCQQAEMLADLVSSLSSSSYSHVPSSSPSRTCIALRTIPHITLATLRLYPNHGTIKLLGSPCSCIPGKGMMHWK